MFAAAVTFLAAFVIIEIVVAALAIIVRSSRALLASLGITTFADAALATVVATFVVVTFAFVISSRAVLASRMVEMFAIAALDIAACTWRS